MKRRDFIKAAIASGALYSTGGLSLLGSRLAHADGFPPLSQHTVMNMMLSGAPDFRHLFPPPYNPNQNSYGYLYWKNKASAHSLLDNAPAFENRWNSDYFHLSDGNTAFGMLGTCGWLKKMWDSGNVAIINNVVGGTTRDHQHCQLIMDHGDRSSEPKDSEKSGWGGRLASIANGNVLALTKSPRLFCYGPHPLDPLSHDNSNLLHARYTRDMSLYRPPASFATTSGYQVISRSMESYYAAKRAEIDVDSIYHKFVKHEEFARTFGDLVDARLASIPLPASISGLTEGKLTDAYLGEQIRDLFDALASSDILDLRVASLEYGSWDSHKNQRSLIEPMFENLFGNGKAFDSLFQELPPNVTDDLVLVLAGEFGRQLRANKDNGSDHGKGTTVLVIGNKVNGGVYGEMFPEPELARLGDRSPDITGLTAIDHVFGAVCDWAVPGGGDVVFPNRVTAPLEQNMSLVGLFS